MAVKRRPRQAVSQLPPSPYNEHPTSARNRECGPVTASTNRAAMGNGLVVCAGMGMEANRNVLNGGSSDRSDGLGSRSLD